MVQETGFAYTLSVIPLFILMGNFVARAGLAHELFHAAYVFIGHLRGVDMFAHTTFTSVMTLLTVLPHLDASHPEYAARVRKHLELVLAAIAHAADHDPARRAA